MSLKPNHKQVIIPTRDPQVAVGKWQRLWLILMVIATAATTIIDAILLQRKFNYFTGGFLTVHYLKGVADTVVFVFSSLIADVGITASLVALSLWLCSSLRLNLKSSMMTSLVLATGPIVIADLMTYRLLDYVGDVFDLPLAFEIAGHSLTELLTVASSHLIVPLFLLLGAIVALILLIWVANGYWNTSLPPHLAIGRISLQSGAIFLMALLVTCGVIVSSEKLDYGLRRKPSAKLFTIIGETLTDFDRDGYGLLSRPKDMALFNSRIFPYAVEIPGNGIDENGVGGDLKVDAVTNSNTSIDIIPWKSHPHVILIVLETFRADLIERTYEGKPVTPVLNKLAQEGISATLSFSHIGSTAPSRYHLFSGMLLTASGGTTLIDDFKSNGYEVAYFSAENESFGGEIYNIGFDRVDISYDARVEPHMRYTDFSTPGSIALPYDVIIERVTNFLTGRATNRPLFLYVNFQDAHFPYHHRKIRPLLNQTALSRDKIRPDRAADLWATYMNTAANVDMAVGEIIEAAKRFLRGSAPGVIVTADHGESLYDDGFLGHGFAVNDEQTRIPLIVANLPIIVEQPFGKAQLRGALKYALQREPGGTSSPVLTENPAATVFQYLGNLKNPSQIGLRGRHGRITYDFQTNRVQISSNSWRRPTELTNDEFVTFQKLVNLWECMIIESQKAKTDR